MLWLFNFLHLLPIFVIPRTNDRIFKITAVLKRKYEITLGQKAKEMFRCFIFKITQNRVIQTHFIYFDVLLTVHLSIFISVINQLDAQTLFHNKFYFMPLHVSSTCAHHQEVKIALHSLRYHVHVHETATYSFDDTRGCVMRF